jgi:dipeptidyl aminopeptidase/acylaminoacyl peptidase
VQVPQIARPVRRSSLLLLLALSGLPGGAAAQPAPCSAEDGCLLASEPIALTKSYDELEELAKFRFPRPDYEEAKNQREFEARRIVYRSGGLRVEGFLYKPRETAGKKLPLILYNRGGTADYGALAAEDLVTFYFWAREGFVVLASNYRGAGGGEGVDEWGGADVDDVLNLVPLVRGLDYVDPDNLFMIGLSRGGPMTFLAIKRKIPINAAAVLGGVTDLSVPDMQRPAFIEGDTPELRSMGWPGWRKLWPDYEHRAAEHLAARSAVKWPEVLDVPLLLLHARDDKRVPVEHALRLAALLQQHGKEYELVVYGHDGHSLPLHRKDRDEHIFAWFRSHLKKASEPAAAGPPG